MGVWSQTKTYYNGSHYSYNSGISTPWVKVEVTFTNSEITISHYDDLESTIPFTTDVYYISENSKRIYDDKTTYTVRHKNSKYLTYTLSVFNGRMEFQSTSEPLIYFKYHLLGLKK